MAKVAGTCFFKIDGVQYSLRGNLTITGGNVHRESVVGQDGYHGFKEVPEVASIQADLTHQPNIDLNILNNFQNVTVTAELINGAVATLHNAVQMNHISLNAEDGKLTVKFEGPSLEWQTVTQTAAQSVV